MKITFTILACLFTISAAWSQPANDNCANAIVLELSDPMPCPSSLAVTDNFTGTTIGASPIMPYPSFPVCNNPIANEVWYTFTAKANFYQIKVTGLNSPAIVLYRGTDCATLLPNSCELGSNSSVILNEYLDFGETVYFMVSGGSVNDNGNFSIEIKSSRDCYACLFAQSFTVSPLPINGQYHTGQEVNFCLSIDRWDSNATGTIEWLHALKLEWGDGWENSAPSNIQLPPSCDGNGIWDWYDSWISCNTGDIITHAFGYDSSVGVDCGGSPIDGNPGNNYGDGAEGCGDIGLSSDSPPRVFCWTLTVGNCGIGESTGDLSLRATVYSDGDTGSWGQTGCNTGRYYNFIAAATGCCNDGTPIVVDLQDETCFGENDGSVTVTGVGDPDTFWTYTLFDGNGNQIPGQPPISSSSPVVFSGLAPGGNYTVVVLNEVLGCERTVTFNIAEAMPFTASASVDTVCRGAAFSMMATVFPFDATAAYHWEGPDNYSSTAQNPVDATVAGTYSLVVSIGECTADSIFIEATFFDEVDVHISTSDTISCSLDTVTLIATGAVSYQWMRLGGTTLLGISDTLQLVVSGQDTIVVLGTGSHNCMGSDTIVLNAYARPTLEVAIPEVLCSNDTFNIQVSGADTYLWGDDTVTTSNHSFYLPAGNYQFEVFGTDTLSGCSSTITLDFEVGNLPDVVITPSGATICAGDSIELVAEGASTYQWSNGLTDTTIFVQPADTTTYTVIGTAENGCVGTGSMTVFVDSPLEAPEIICEGSLTSVQFYWQPVEDAVDYQVEVLTGQTGVLDGTSFLVMGLQPNEMVSIRVTTISGNACPNTSTELTCSAMECPDVDVVITEVSGLCINAAAITLTATVSDSEQGVLVWEGDGIIDNMQGNFDPAAAGVGVHPVIASFVSDSGNTCTYTDTTAIVVYDIPNASFSIDVEDPCTSDEVVISYTGTATADADYVWDFDGGTIISGNGQGPYTVNWSESGLKQVTLLVEENGCSASSSTFITLNAALTIPDVNCGELTATSVEFYWPVIPEAVSYEVEVLTGQSGTLVGTTYSVGGLMPEETVSIVVTAHGAGNCASVMTEAISCQVLDCGLMANFDFEISGTSVSFNNLSTGGGAYQWNFGDGQTSTDEAPTHQYDTIGTYMVTLSITNDCGTSTSSQQVFLVDAVVNIDLVDEFRVFPNPNRGRFNVEVMGQPTETITLTYYTLMGQELKIERVDFSSGHLLKEINLPDFTPGIYLLKLNYSGVAYYKKVVIL